MQVSTINNQTNPNFNAQIKYFGDKRALPVKALKKLEEKAAKIGEKDDVIYFYVNRGLVVEKKLVSNFFFEFYKNNITYYYNKILTSYGLHSLKEYSEKPSFAKIFSHSKSECKEKSFSYLDEYLDNLKNKFQK
jgi:hypothetical protein